MRTNLDRISRRDALARFAAGGAALLWAGRGRADGGGERPPARIYVSTSGSQGEFRPEVSGILAIDPKDGSWTQVLPESYLYPRVSPDGRKLLCFKVRPREDWGIYLGDSRGEDPPRKILATQGVRYLWSPDGKQIIVLESKEDGTKSYWRMNLDGTGRVEVPIPATDGIIDWSPDGRWFLTASRRAPRDGEAQDKHRAYLMHPDGTGERLLLETDRINNFHAFSPDGRTLAYTLLQRDGNGPFHGPYRIEMIDVDGKNRRTFLDHDGDEGPYMAVWSPDGTELAVQFREERLKEGEAVSMDTIFTRLEIISADGKRRRRLDVLKDVRFFPGGWR